MNVELRGPLPAVRADGRFRSRSSTRGAAILLLAVGVVLTTADPAFAASPKVAARPARVDRCPWVAASRAHRQSPAALANEVLSHMSLAEEVGFVVLAARGGYENTNDAVPSLCLPALTLQDGPNGISFHASGVTQLPSSLGVAASFDTSLAYAYGRVEGAEARGKGIDVVQGPNLNLARVPTSGRIFEGYGEDPVLVSKMGTADILGIQSEHVMADAKHFTAYNQETARLLVDEVVARRALEELYLAPFEAAVRDGHVASIMCAYGSLDGVNDCSDPLLYRTLRSWGFTGFVRSDLAAVQRPVAAFRAGLDLIKPLSDATLLALVEHGEIRKALLTEAVRRTLEEMFAFGLVAHRPRGSIHAVVATPAHARLAVRAAEESMVLLKNSRGVLPLSPSTSSIAVIGADASTGAMTTGSGSARVIGPVLVTPLESIRRALGPRSRVSYVAGVPAKRLLEPIARSAFVRGAPLSSMVPPSRPEQPGTGDLGVLGEASVTRAAATASRPGVGSEWTSWTATVVVPRTGQYELSVEENGDTWLYLDHRALLLFPGLHGRSSGSTTVTLVRGRRYILAMRWFAIDGTHNPRLGWQDVTPMIRAAVDAARRSHVAVVFVNDYSGEGADRPGISLPGAEDALVSAVAAANPRTVVVLDTGGAVLMPWLARVRAVLEAWYPGQGDGTATAAVLFGHVDPSGRLPVTFPASIAETPVSSPGSFPGTNATVDYREGLDIGYRWYEAHHVTPLFPFGFGLSYTSFALSRLHVATGTTSDTVTVRVANTGRRNGTEVVEAYLAYPASAGEPPSQLRAFTTVYLRAGRSATATLHLERSGFEAYLEGRFRTVAGQYTIAVGSSSADLPLTATLTAP